MWGRLLLVACLLPMACTSRSSRRQEEDAWLREPRFDYDASIDANRAGFNIESFTVGMVHIPAGDFDQRCSGRRCPWTVPEYYIDRHEVTVAEYRGCVDRGDCTAPVAGESCPEVELNWNKADRGQHPVNCVTSVQAGLYCAHRRMHLPTADQWEKAILGLDGARFPWGEEDASCARAVIAESARASSYGCGTRTTAPVGSKPAGAGPFGVLDGVGNVQEFTATGTRLEPKDPTNVENWSSLRGGGFKTPAEVLDQMTRDNVAASYKPKSDVGFRCAYQPSFVWGQRGGVGSP